MLMNRPLIMRTLRRTLNLSEGVHLPGTTPLTDGVRDAVIAALEKHLKISDFEFLCAISVLTGQIDMDVTPKEGETPALQAGDDTLPMGEEVVAALPHGTEFAVLMRRADGSCVGFIKPTQS